jgi:hypothetical protein
MDLHLNVMDIPADTINSERIQIQYRPNCNVRSIIQPLSYSQFLQFSRALLTL